MDGTFSGQVVVISGGSKGLGLALAQELGRHGAHVVLFSRHEDEAALAAASLLDHGFDADGYTCDVSDRIALTNRLHDVEDRLGGIDVLVNNAGVIQVGHADTMAADDYAQVLDVMFGACCTGRRRCCPA